MRHGTRRRVAWSSADTEKLRAIFPTATLAEMEEAFGRPYCNIHKRAKLLGLKRSPEYLAQDNHRRKVQHTKPVGVIRRRPNGYLEIKTDNGWQYLQRYIWERNFGSIPPDHGIKFQDRDKGNCDPSNLRLVDLRKFGEGNRIYPVELQELAEINRALKKTIRKMKHGQEQDQRSA